MRSKPAKTILTIGLALSCMTGMLTSAGAQSVPPIPTQSPSYPARRQVVISLPDRKLAVVENGAVIVVFAVAVGASVSPTPTGSFEIVSRLSDPTYYHAGVVIPAGKDNPLGPRWVGLSKQGYGIHGTNAPGSIGKAASHGCIRLRNRDIVQLFTLVRVGDTVEIHGERDEQIAELFGAGNSNPNQLAQAQPTAAAIVGGGQ